MGVFRFSFVSASLLLVALSAAPSAQGLPSWLPKQPWNRTAEKQVVKGFQRGEVGVDTVDRLIIFRWQATAYAGATPYFALSEADAGQFPYSDSVQKQAVRWWPFEVCVVNENKVLVGGVTSAGETVIELWTLGWPVAMPAPITNAQTGLTTVAVVKPNILSITSLYRASVSGRFVVRNMSRIKKSTGSITQALVQFDDSGDLYTLDLDDGDLTLVASSATPGGALGLIPALAEHRNEQCQWDHVVEGYVYILPNLSGIVRSPSDTTLVLTDPDRNGILDGWELLTEDQWNAGAWSDPANYNGLQEE